MWLLVTTFDNEELDPPYSCLFQVNGQGPPAHQREVDILPSSDGSQVSDYLGHQQRGSRQYNDPSVTRYTREYFERTFPIIGTYP